MAMIPRSFIDDLIARVDIVELIDGYVPLKRTGKNYSACCPFHQEKTPSFTVSSEKQFYHCFGCGQSGNAIGFLMEYQRQDFVEAIESLASRMGIEVPRETNPQKQKQYNQNKPIYALLEVANQHYQQQLRQAADKERAVEYLKRRGLSGQIAKQFQLGYAPPGWNVLLHNPEVENYPAKLMVDAGLSIAKNEQGIQERALQYDRFRDRIMFPIRDSRGRCIGFGGRVLGDEKPKYLNSPETPVFNKGKELYGWYEAKQANNKLDKVIVVEGYMDVIALAQSGITNSVATLGTAIGSDHLHLLFRSISEIVFCFDGDKAGRQAAERALHNSLPFLQDGRQIRFLFLAEGEDPDSTVRKDGPELFLHKADDAKPLSEFLFDHLGQSLDLSTMDGRASLAKQAITLINQIPHGLFYEMMLGRLAEITQLDRAMIVGAVEESERIEQQKIADRDAQRAREAHFQKTKNGQGDGNHLDLSSSSSDTLPSLDAYQEPYEEDSELRESYTQGASHYQSSPSQQSSQQSPTFQRSLNPAAPKEPRVSSVNKVLSYLLREPGFAISSDIPNEVHRLEAHNIDLLIELIGYIKNYQAETANLPSTAMILGHWHNSKAGFLLASLAASEPLLDPSAWEREFKDALQTLIKQFFHQEIREIKGSSEAEKQRLKELLLEKSSFEARFLKGENTAQAPTIADKNG